jgi:hypothetical protein
MTTLTIDPKSIKANGISYYGSVRKHIAFVENAIAVFRLRYTYDDLVKKWPQDDYYEGRRFQNNEDVAARLLSAVSGAVNQALREAGIEPYNEDNTATKDAIALGDHFMSTLSGTDLNGLISDAMRECASADHWYTFEKEY